MDLNNSAIELQWSPSTCLLSSTPISSHKPADCLGKDDAVTWTPSTEDKSEIESAASSVVEWSDIESGKGSVDSTIVEWTPVDATSSIVNWSDTEATPRHAVPQQTPAYSHALASTASSGYPDLAKAKKVLFSSDSSSLSEGMYVDVVNRI